MAQSECGMVLSRTLVLHGCFTNAVVLVLSSVANNTPPQTWGLIKRKLYFGSCICKSNTVVQHLQRCLLLAESQSLTVHCKTRGRMCVWVCVLFLVSLFGGLNEKYSLIDYYVCVLGPQLMALSAKIMYRIFGRYLLAGGSTLLGWALMVYTLVPFLGLSLICVYDWTCDQSASCCPPVASIALWTPKLSSECFLPFAALVHGVSSQQQKSN